MTTVLDRTCATAASASSRPGPTGKPALPSPKVVSVDGTVIPRDVIARETQNHPAERPLDAWTAAARALVVRELLLQEARRRGLVPEPMVDTDGRRETEEEALVRQLMQQEAVPVEPDEATCRRFYRQHRERFRASDLWAVRHILLAAAPDDGPRRERVRGEAEALVGEIGAAPDRFAALAEARSACPSKAQGGSLGQISRGQTVPEFEEGLAGLGGPGAVGTIETRYGVHVVVLDRHLAGDLLPFEIAEPRIAGWLRERSHRTSVRRTIARLAAKAAITGIDLGLDPTSRAFPDTAPTEEGTHATR
jgi:peptidyl-prolyl cis-trans isomerase C